MDMDKQVSLAPRARRSFLRPDLPLIVLLASLPLALFAAAVVLMLWHQQQEQFEIQQKARARAIAVAVEKEIAMSVRQLQYMASSPLLGPYALESFSDNARRALATTREWTNVLVFAADGRQLINVRYGPAATRDSAGQRHVKRVLESGRAAVSDLFVGPASKRHVLAVTVPVVRDGRAVYALSAALEFSPFDRLVQEGATDAAVVAIWDGQNQFVTRSLSPAAFRGQHPVPQLIDASRSAREGWERFITYEGTQVFTAWTPVGSTGWTIAVAVPSAEADAVLRRYLWFLGIAEGLIMLMALPIGLKLGREARERMRAEAERDRLFALERVARAAAETASKSKDEFLAMLGHELRNPLAAMSNAVQLLEDHRAPPESAAFARKIIARQTGQLAHLIDDLLDVGRVVTGKIHLQKATLDLGDATETAINTVQASGHAAQHRLVFTGSPVYVEADRTRMEQIITNLVSNAIAYTPAGGEIRVSVKREGANAVLAIEDEGIGLEPHELERVFELFFQAKHELHRQGGLGIGLTLVRRLVELHSGTVSVESEGAGKGTRFIVRLPAVEPSMPEFTAAPKTTRLRAPLSILLVEDNEDARESLARILTLEGHTVHTAADGVSGVAVAERVRPNVAIVDVGLPTMDGYEVARRIRANTHHRVTLIALTGYGQAEDARRAREAGFDAHLVKPADFGELRALLATASRVAA
jgi:signal transduction histidine kinase/ActR/RegA family two-component response regulator